MKSILLAAMVTAGLMAPAAAQELLKPVKLMTVGAEHDAGARQFFGQVVARQTVDLAFQVGGQLNELPLVEGREVSKGDLVARLDTEPFELALEQAILQREQAERAVKRYEQLSGSTISQVALEDANTQAALARVAERNATYELEHASLFAPFDGLISARLVENFTTISAGTPVVRLHDLSEVRIEIDVPEILFQRAGAEPNVEITAQFPVSDEVFPLELREFDAETSDIGQTYQITLGMTPPEHLNILPGSSVTVTMRLISDDADLRIPATALHFSPSGETSVMVFEPTNGDVGTLTSVPVSVTPDVTGQLIVLSGLEAGQEIAIMGGDTLSDGQRVRRFQGFGR